MRSSIYLVTALIALGIAYLLAQAPAEPATGSSAAPPATATSAGVLADAGTLTLRVEDMHCEYGCFPKVKKTLEGFDHVVAVQLDQQAEEGTLDNPQVLLSYEPGFDLLAAQEALAKNGFAKTRVIP